MSDIEALEDLLDFHKFKSVNIYRGFVSTSDILYEVLNSKSNPDKPKWHVIGCLPSSTPCTAQYKTVRGVGTTLSSAINNMIINCTKESLKHIQCDDFEEFCKKYGVDQEMVKACRESMLKGDYSNTEDAIKLIMDRMVNKSV